MFCRSLFWFPVNYFFLMLQSMEVDNGEFVSEPRLSYVCNNCKDAMCCYICKVVSK
jgi:hypothetical protein